MRLLLTLALLAAAPGLAGPPAAPVPSALEPAASGGLTTIDRALAKLATHRRLMVVGAHPDDEDNALLAWVGRGLGGEAAYLSLSRGEGGQNLIGDELGVGLGLVRTGELLAARRLEGTRQFFARAYDFGYTRSIEETAGRWPPELLLEDGVRAVRRFQPQVIVAVFPADERAGHGQHQMAGRIARELFDRSGEPDGFPALTAAGLTPWRPQAIYRRAWQWRGEQGAEVSLGALEPASGRSVAQIAAAARSMHRSQDMGREQPIGGQVAAVIPMAGGADEAGEGPFAGIDTRLEAIAALLEEGPLRSDLSQRLARVEATARAARGRLTPQDPHRVVPDLARIVTDLNAALASLEDHSAPGAPSVRDLLLEKLAVAQAGLAAAAGVVIDATAARAEVAAGDGVEIEAEVWNAGPGAVTVRSVALQTSEGWRARTVDPPPAPLELSAGALAAWRFQASATPDAPPTVPYFLRRVRNADLYDWSGVAEAVRGEPYQPPELLAAYNLEIAGAPVRLEREVVFRTADQAVGEVRRPLRVVPQLELSVSPALALLRSAAGEARVLELSLTSNVQRALRGRLEVELGGGFRVEGPREFAIDAGAAGQALRWTVTPPAGAEAGAWTGEVTAVLSGGERYAAAYPTIEYPHVRPASLPSPSRFEIRVLDLELPAGRRIGYVRGASDRVPELLAEVGLPVDLLDEAALRSRDLSPYDAVVIGSRAYETEPLLARVNGRLLEYARAGGLVLVQYQQYAYSGGGFAPRPLQISRPHGRVTDESSPVRLLRPDHPVFTTPNRLGPQDWAGWVQERGLYFAGVWDDAWEPLLSLQDPGWPEERGALLVARTGRGWYVYTGLSFFRQLPAGVPGAYRLLANLLALAGQEGGRD